MKGYKNCYYGTGEDIIVSVISVYATQCGLNHSLKGNLDEFY